LKSFTSFLDRLQQARLLVTVQFDMSQADEPIWSHMDDQINSHLSLARIRMIGSASNIYQHLPWRLLKPGRKLHGRRKYSSVIVPAGSFTASELKKRFSKDSSYLPHDSDSNLVLVGEFSIHSMKNY